MPISSRVQRSFFKNMVNERGEVIRLAQRTTSTSNAWSLQEHERFLQGLELYPQGPWKQIAEYVGSRTARQTMTHAQKYRQKIARRARGLQARKASRPSTPPDNCDELEPLPIPVPCAYSSRCPEEQHRTLLPESPCDTSTLDLSKVIDDIVFDLHAAPQMPASSAEFGSSELWSFQLMDIGEPVDSTILDMAWLDQEQLLTDIVVDF